MIITAEISLYPLANDYEPPILEYIALLREQPGIAVHTHSTATKVNGEYEAVQKALDVAMKTTFERHGKAVVVVKYLHADLPVDQ